jgi:hypothetical protein
VGVLVRKQKRKMSRVGDEIELENESVPTAGSERECLGREERIHRG